MRRQRVSPDDAAWLHMDSPENLMVVNTLVQLGGVVTLDELAAVVEERVLDTFPRFRQRVTNVPPTLGALGGPHWEDDPNFRIERHLRHERLESVDAVEPDEPDVAVGELVSRLASVPLDPARPQWCLHLIDGVGHGSALLLRTHHSMADGLGLVQLVLALADRPTGSSLHAGQMELADPSPARGRRSRAGAARSAMSSAVEGSVSLFANPARMRAAAAGARETARVYRKLGLLADQRNPWHGQPAGTKRLTWSAPVPLDTVKLVSAATGATVNDIALAAITGAMHDLFVDAGPLPERVGVTVPFNLRTLDEPLAVELGNQIGLVFINLPVGMDDPHDRLDHIARRMAAIKASPEGEVVRSGMSMVGVIPQGGLVKAWMEQFTRKSTAIVTNIAGPRDPLALAGVPIESFMLWVPTSGSVGVGLSIVTYAGQLRIGVQVDTAIVPDPQRFVALLDAELARVDRFVLAS